MTPAPLAQRLMAYFIDVNIVSMLIFVCMLPFMVALAYSFAQGDGATKLMSAVMYVQAGGSPSTLMTEPAFMGIMSASLIASLAAIMVWHGYFIYYEHRKGRTPGKKLLGLQVVSLTGAELKLNQCVMRDFMRYIDCGLILPGLISMMASPRGQRLGDRAASTLVIESPPAQNYKQ